MAKKEFSAGGIVARKRGKKVFILLMKDRFGHWIWPKGHIEKAESPEETAVREVTEETGLKDVTAFEKIGRRRYFFKEKGILTLKTVFLYLCEAKNARLKIQRSEIKTARWFAPKEALKMIGYKGSGKILEKAVKRFCAVKRLPFTLLWVSIFTAALGSLSFADTVYMKNRGIIKGMVVENYVDRIIFSTISGEIKILKSEIARIEYDEPIDNLVNLGDSAFEAGYYEAALKYYLAAQGIKGDIDTLNNKIYHTEALIQKMPELQKAEQLEIKNEIIAERTSSPPAPSGEEEYKKMLLKELGVSISRGADGRFCIENLKSSSPFAASGARPGDVIIAVWSKMTSHLGFENIYKLLMNPAESMTAVTIERKLGLPDNGPFGAKLTVEWEGMIVDTVAKKGAAEAAGLKKDDLVVAVGEKSIRYVPLKTALKWLEERTPGATVTIQRKLVLFREN